MKRIWGFIGRYAEQIKIGFAIFAALWIYYEFLGKQHEARIERAIAYIKRAGEDKLLDAEIKRTRHWIGLQEKLLAVQGNQDEFNKLSIKSGQALFDEVWLALNFFKDLAVCVNTGLCDTDTACSRFSRDIEVFLSNYKAYFEAYQKIFREDVLRPVRNMQTTKCRGRFLK